MPTTTLPDGSTITTTTAFTPQTIAVFFQRLTASILGLTPASDSDSSVWSKVRLDWVQGGQPAFAITDDVCFVKAVESDDPFGRYRSKVYVPNANPLLISQELHYTRVWNIHWTTYGPNCFDRARQIKDGVLAANYSYELLTQSNLYVVPDVGPLHYAPENFQGRWWNRTDFFIPINEAIVETQTLTTIGSVEVDLNSEHGSVTTTINE